MALLIIGLCLFVGTHIAPMLAGQSVKQAAKNKVGAHLYKAVFSVFSVVGVILMVVGYQSGSQTHLFITFYEVYWGLLIVSAVGLFIFIAGQFPGVIRQWLDHPMMIGTALFSGAHLGLNGDVRSVVLFAGLLLWSVLTLIILFKRDGKQSKPSKGVWVDIASVVVAVGIIFAIIMVGHQYLAGVELYIVS